MQEAQPLQIPVPDVGCVLLLHTATVQGIASIDFKFMRDAPPGRCSTAVPVRRAYWRPENPDMDQLLAVAVQFAQVRLWEEIGLNHPNWRVMYSRSADASCGAVMVERMV
jgi:hypothetical protein